MENITPTEILTTYWSQFTLILFGIGYVIKIIVQSWQKKSEINHNLLQQRKLDALNRFFTLYSEIHQMWYDFYGYKIKSKNLTSVQLDDLILNPLNKFKSSTLELKIYFDSNITNDFDKISQNFFEINGLLKLIFFNSNPNELSVLVLKFEEEKEKLLTENEKIIINITNKVKRIFK